jgi:hypothetical protein
MKKRIQAAKAEPEEIGIGQVLFSWLYFISGL